MPNSKDDEDDDGDDDDDGENDNDVDGGVQFFHTPKPCIRSSEAGLEDVGLGVKILSRFCANTPKSGVVRKFKFFVGIKILGRAWDTPKIEES